MPQLKRIAQIETPESAPRYELRVRRHGLVGTEYEIWQMPTVATPQVTSPLRVAGLRGRNLDLVEDRVLKRLWQSGIKPDRRADARKRGYARHRRSGADVGTVVPCAGPDAQPRQHAGGCGRDRIHGARRGCLLVGHGDAPQAAAPSPCGTTVPSDRAGGQSR